MATEQKLNTKFQYFINKKQTVAVVSFMGNLLIEDAATLNKCLEEIIASGIQNVVINFAGIGTLDRESVRNLIIFQQALRTKSINLKLCSINPEHLKSLNAAGAVRNYELFNDLVAALQAIIKKT